MRTRVRLFATLLVIVMIVAMLPITASASDTVAVIGSNEFSSLQEAINASSEGDTIKLVEPISEEYVTVPATADITLDLGGMSINITSNATNAGRAITNNGKLKIVDSLGGGSINCTNNANTAIVNNHGGEVILDGDFTLTNVKSYVIVNLGKMTIENVTVDSKAFESSAVENGYNDINNLAGVPNVHELKAELTVNGGTFIGALNTFKNDVNGYLTINGGVIINKINGNAGKSPSAILNWNVAVINDVVIDAGDAFVIKTGAHKKIDGEEWRYETTKGELTINGGTFNGTGNMFKLHSLDTSGIVDCNLLNIKLNYGTFDAPLNEPEMGDFVISGGKYKTDISNYLSIEEGMVAIRDGERFSVEPQIFNAILDMGGGTILDQADVPSPAILVEVPYGLPQWIPDVTWMNESTAYGGWVTAPANSVYKGVEITDKNGTKFYNPGEEYRVVSDVIVKVQWESTVPPAAVTYTVSGGNATWTKGTTDPVVMTVKRSVEDETTHRRFEGLDIDGTTLVRGTDYTDAEGSVVVTINPAALEKLSVGDHNVTLRFNDGTVVIGLTVKAAAQGGTTPTGGGAAPQTGDESGIVLWMSLTVLAAATVIALLLRPKKSASKK